MLNARFRNSLLLAVSSSSFPLLPLKHLSGSIRGAAELEGVAEFEGDGMAGPKILWGQQRGWVSPSLPLIQAGKAPGLAAPGWGHLRN